MPDLKNTNEILSFAHCGLCVEDVENGVGESPRDYARLEIGWTELGLQVWCVRHECNVMHIDFEGAKHPADTTRIHFQKPRAVK